MVFYEKEERVTLFVVLVGCMSILFNFQKFVLGLSGISPAFAGLCPSLRYVPRCYELVRRGIFLLRERPA